MQSHIGNLSKSVFIISQIMLLQILNSGNLQYYYDSMKTNLELRLNPKYYLPPLPHCLLRESFQFRRLLLRSFY